MMGYTAHDHIDDGEFPPVLVQTNGWLIDGADDNPVLNCWAFESFWMLPGMSVVAQVVLPSFLLQNQFCHILQVVGVRRENPMSSCSTVVSTTRQHTKIRIYKGTLEPVHVVAIDGHQISAVGDFKHLGTMMSNYGGAVLEAVCQIQITALDLSHLDCGFRVAL